MHITRWLAKQQLPSPVHLMPGNIITAHWDLEGGTKSVSKTITEFMIIDEVRLFTATLEDRNAIGGLFMEQKK
jgi:hypothetical protein